MLLAVYLPKRQILLGWVDVGFSLGVRFGSLEKQELGFHPLRRGPELPWPCSMTPGLPFRLPDMPPTLGPARATPPIWGTGGSDSSGVLCYCLPRLLSPS